MEKNSFISNFKAFHIPILIASLFLLTEIGFRVYFFGIHTVFNWKKYNPQGILVTDIVHKVDDPNISWKLTPNISKYFQAKMFTTNSLGFRNPEIKLNKQTGITRIAVLGRSITMGWGVNDNDVFTSVLQNKLDEWKPDSYEIINCSVGGHNIIQMLNHYESYVDPIKPDIIFIPMSIRDINEKIKETPRQISTAKPKVTNIRYYLSFTFTYVAARSIVRKQSKKIFSIDWNTRYNDLIASKTLMINAEPIISQFIEKRYNEGIPCYIFAARPLKKLTIKDKEKYREQLMEWSKSKNGTKFLDTYKHTIGKKPKNSNIYLGDSHPSAEKHILFAEALFLEMKSIISFVQ